MGKKIWQNDSFIKSYNQNLAFLSDKGIRGIKLKDIFLQYFQLRFLKLPFKIYYPQNRSSNWQKLKWHKLKSQI